MYTHTHKNKEAYTLNCVWEGGHLQLHTQTHVYSSKWPILEKYEKKFKYIYLCVCMCVWVYIYIYIYIYVCVKKTE